MEYTGRTYVLTSTAVHEIRSSLQIILDYAEIQKSEVLIRQVHRITDAIDARTSTNVT